QGLPHLERHDPAELVLLGVEDLACAMHAARAVGEGGAAMALECECGALEGRVELGVGELVEARELRVGRGVDRFQHDRILTNGERNDARYGCRRSSACRVPAASSWARRSRVRRSPSATRQASMRL